jgi:hypothetical protein
VNAIAQIGHNQGPSIDLAAALEPEALTAWIGDRLSLHTTRGLELLAGHKRFLLATSAGIANDDAAGKATVFARQIKEAIDETDAERVRIKAPVLAAQRAIDGAAKVITDPLLMAKGECERRVTAYLVEQDRLIRKAAAEEAARAEQLAAVLMDQAANDDDPDIIEQAATAEVEQFAAQEVVYAPTADLTRMKTAGVTSSLRDNWVFEISNINEVPAHFLMVNEAAVRAAIKGGNRSIPGLTIRNQPKVGIR